MPARRVVHFTLMDFDYDSVGEGGDFIQAKPVKGTIEVLVSPEESDVVIRVADHVLTLVQHNGRVMLSTHRGYKETDIPWFKNADLTLTLAKPKE